MIFYLNFDKGGGQQQQQGGSNGYSSGRPNQGQGFGSGSSFGSSQHGGNSNSGGFSGYPQSNNGGGFGGNSGGFGGQVPGNDHHLKKKLQLISIVINFLILKSRHDHTTIRTKWRLSILNEK